MGSCTDPDSLLLYSLDPESPRSTMLRMATLSPSSVGPPSHSPSVQSLTPPALLFSSTYQQLC